MFQYFKTGVVAAALNAGTGADNQRQTAMEGDTISKHRRSSKSHTSRRYFLGISCSLMTAIALCFFTSASAQQGEKGIGGNLIIGTGDDYTHFGVGAKFVYNVSDPIRLAVEFDFFPKKDQVSWTDFSMYGHYLISVNERNAVYPAFGLGMVGVQAGGASASEFAFSFGGGFDHAVSSNLLLNFELRFKILDGLNRTNFLVGLTHKF